MPNLPEGVFLVDKPIGMTSFDVVRRLRKTRNVRKIGHAGTLDPLASGLMILAVGPATKLLHDYLKLPKSYEAEICLGERTATGDREGEVLEKSDASHLEEAAIAEVLTGMAGTLQLPVPAYSAIKRNGEALYKKARRGEQVDTPIKSMEIARALLTGVRRNKNTLFVSVLFKVGSGTYIRSLAEELGNRLGIPARLENLRRTQIGAWSINQATSLEHLPTHHTQP